MNEVPQFGENDLLPLVQCFGSEEHRLLLDIFRGLHDVPATTRVEIERAFRQALGTIPPVVRAMEACPIAHGAERLGGRERDPDSLIESLCQESPLMIEFCIPTTALLGRALVLARINFLKALEYSLSAVPEEKFAHLCHSLREAIDDAVFSKLAEQLLTGVVSNERNDAAVRRAAARKLLVTWEDCVTRPVGHFPTVLLSAWKARRKVRTIYGTLLGSDEVLSLIREECEERFVSFFTREHVTSEEMEAFREFLFGLPYEEIEQVRNYMAQECRNIVTREEVNQLVRKTLPPARRGDPTAEEVYHSYRRRRIRADYRSLTGSPGPRKTAEGYIMEALLREEIAGQSP